MQHALHFSSLATGLGLMAFIANGSYSVIFPSFSCLPESILVQWSRSQGCELTLEGRAVSQGAAFDSRLCRYCILPAEGNSESQREEKKLIKKLIY